MCLLDTNVVSELRKARCDPAVRRWGEAQDATTLFLSVITVLELETGVQRLERKDPAQGALLRAWLDHHLLPAFAHRLLPVDLAVCRTAAGLQVPDPMPQGDVLLAATAIAHGLTMVTRNTADFARTGVRLLDPWQPP